jgi:uncharacterized OsmC-like protein
VPFIDRATLRQNHEQTIQQLADDPAFGLMRPTVTARVDRDVSVVSTFEQYGRPFTFHSDEAASRGGQETGPSPMRYFLSGIAFCLLGWWVKGSAASDIELMSLEVRIDTLLDMRGEHGFADVPKNPQWLILGITVTSEAADDQVLAAIDWGDERCPLGVLVRRAIPVHERVTHNGNVIRDTVPPDVG